MSKKRKVVDGINQSWKEDGKAGAWQKAVVHSPVTIYTVCMMAGPGRFAAHVIARLLGISASSVWYIVRRYGRFTMTDARNDISAAREQLKMAASFTADLPDKEK